jgi:ArsR family transcriptional regulator
MPNREQRLARIFSALSNPNRVKIYNEILRAEKANYAVGHRCLLSQVIGSLKIKSPTISHHVKELVDAGLIIAEREGKFLVCRINPDTRDLVVRLFG